MTVVVRSAPVGLGSMTNLTEPFPEPERPDVMLIQLALSAAVQEQPVLATTSRDVVCPATVGVSASGLTLKLHETTSWVILNVTLPTEIDPCRSAAPVFAVVE